MLSGLAALTYLLGAGRRTLGEAAPRLTGSSDHLAGVLSCFGLLGTARSEIVQYLWTPAETYILCPRSYHDASVPRPKGLYPLARILAGTASSGR